MLQVTPKLPERTGITQKPTHYTPDLIISHSCYTTHSGGRLFQDDVGTDLPGVKKPGPQYHDGLTGALFQLHLDGREFLVDDLHHAFYLLRRDWARPGLFPEEVHHMRRELVTCLQQNNTFVPDRIRFSSESHTHTHTHLLLTDPMGKGEGNEEGDKEEIFMEAKTDVLLYAVFGTCGQ